MDMKYITIITLNFLILSSPLFAQQWSQMGLLNHSVRYDDVYFYNKNLGWTVNGDGQIYKTENGGDDWQEVYANPAYYFRAIEFLDDKIGFAGTLNNVFLKTVDGGNTWEEIQDLIPSYNTSICGLSHINHNVYGVGIWRHPAYFIKSRDKGLSWTYTNLSHLADGLVECHFINSDVGFISGIDEDLSGGVILKTTDGGNTWSRVLETQNGTEYIWKLDFVTNQIAYGAIQNFTGNPARIVKSTDGGDHWEILEVDSIQLDLQGIGFINENLGWVGPRNQRMYETTDGGLSWHQTNLYGNINRFFRLGSKLMYASGSYLYKYDEEAVSTQTIPVYEDKHKLSVNPNPFDDRINISVKIGETTSARLDLFNEAGQLITNIYAGQMNIDDYYFSINTPITSKLSDGLYYVVLRTNQGFFTVTTVKGK